VGRGGDWITRIGNCAAALRAMAAVSSLESSSMTMISSGWSR
jgi:hypothetical protein